MLAHMPLLIMLTPMQKFRMLLAILLVHCCVANATVAAAAQAVDACDDAMFTCLQIIYLALIIYNVFMKWCRNFM
jgi:hypothetical protein